MTQFSYRGDDGVGLFARGLSGESVRADDRTVVLLHGGGPDHESLVPLGEALSDLGSVILPDVRGYGRSVCPDPSAHTWSRYAADLIRLFDTLGIERAVVGGAGLGGTVAARTALACPGRVEALILISVEDVEDDVAKAAEIAFMDAFASRVREAGLAAAWAPILPELAPIIRAMVEDAIPRSDPRSVAAAAAIGRDRSFRTLEDLGAIQCPTLIVAGMDWRHPPELAARMAALMPDGRLAPTSLSRDIRTMSEFADALAPAIRDFLSTLPKRPSDAPAVAPDPLNAGSGSPASG